MSNAKRDRRTSNLWSVFTPIGKKKLAQCGICQQILSYKSSISNLKKHLNKKHTTSNLCESYVKEEENKNLDPDSNLLHFEEVIVDTQTLQEEDIVGGTTEYVVVEAADCDISPNKKSRGVAKSAVWSFFTPYGKKIHGMAQCNLCGRSLCYKSTVTNLRKHLNKKHPTVQIGEKREDEGNIDSVSNNTMISNNTMTLNNTMTSRELTDSKGTHNHIISSSVLVQDGAAFKVLEETPTKVSKWSKKKVQVEQKDKVDKALLDLFIMDYQPFSIVEDKGFINLVKCLDPNYNLPTRKTISKSIFPQLYKECKATVEQHLDAIESACLTTETWTSAANEFYLTVTAHYITTDFEMKSILLDCCVLDDGADSSQNLASVIKTLVENNKLLRKVILVVTDNSENIKRAITNELKWSHLPCAAYLLNLVVQDALTAVSEVHKKVKTIVTYFKTCTWATEKLQIYQIGSGCTYPKSLITDTAVRWNSTLNMFNRMTELQEAINNTIDLGDNDVPKLTTEEWTTCYQLCLILKPVEEVTKILNAEKYPSASLLMVMISGLSKVLTNLNEKGDFSLPAKQMLELLLDGIKKQFPNYETSKTISICALLDPRFKLLAFTSNGAADAAKTNLVELVKEIYQKKEEHQSIRVISDKQQIDEEVDIWREYDKVVASTQTNDSATSRAIAEIQSSLEESVPRRSVICVCEEPQDHKELLDIWSEYDKIVASTQPAGTAASRAIAEVERYLEEPVIGRKENPLQWWRYNSIRFPHLAQISQKVLNTVATSIPCERLFTKLGSILNDRRTRFGPGTVRKLTYLNANNKSSKK